MGNIQDANRAAADLLHISVPELVGLPILRFFPADDKQNAIGRMTTVRRSSSVEEWETEVRSDAADPVAVSVRLSGGDDSAGIPPVLRWIVRDISESTRRRNALVESELRLKMLHTVKDTFLQSVSHDLRSPLAAVIGLAQTLVREDAHLDEEEVIELLQRILKSAYQMKSLLSDLLDLDRLRGGQMGPTNDPVDLDELAAHAYRQLETRRQRAVELRPSGLVANIDRQILERIMVNLLDNALRYTRPEGSVWFGFEPAGGDNLLLRVDDDGPGVDEGSKEAIFDPFVRVAPTPTVAGTGVGLAIVERFARLLGGRAWVEDRPGGGASFRVLLPGCLPKTRPAAN